MLAKKKGLAVVVVKIRAVMAAQYLVIKVLESLKEEKMVIIK